MAVLAFGIAWLFVAASADAAPSHRPDSPPGSQSEIGAVVVLGGTRAGLVDPVVDKLIVVKDNSGTPVAGAQVILDFTPCAAADVRLASIQPDPELSMDCATHRVWKTTDAAGQVHFRVAGFAQNPGGGSFGAPAPGYGVFGATVKADGVILGVITVATLDQNGFGGVNAVDTALFMNDRFAFNPGDPVATVRGRSDYDGNGAVNPVDLSLLLKAVFLGGSLSSAAAACP